MRILVLGYNRAGALSACLFGLRSARYGERIDLTISLDGDVPAVAAVADAFEWPHGEKLVIRRVEQMGLKRHVLTAITETLDEADSVAVFEDDLFPSPHWHSYANASLHRLAGTPEIAGISLYAPEFNEVTGTRFVPILTGADNYFYQLPSSWGQVFTKEGWLDFVAWRERADALPVELPRAIARWSSHSWKREFVAYMLSEGKFFSYPYWSYSTNLGSPGEHKSVRDTLFNVPLCLGKRDHFQLDRLCESGAVYSVSGRWIGGAPPFTDRRGEDVARHGVGLSPPEANFYLFGRPAESTRSGERHGLRWQESSDELLAVYPIKHVSVAAQLFGSVAKRRLLESLRYARKRLRLPRGKR